MLALYRLASRWPLPLLHALGALLGWLTWLASPTYRRRLAAHAALAGYGFTSNVVIACLCYIAYTFIMPLSTMASSTYLRKIAVPEDLAPSFAMGTTMQHAAAIVVPITAGYILNFYGYQIPFIIACGFACLTFVVTQRLDPVAQRAPERVALDAARLATSGAASDK